MLFTPKQWFSCVLLIYLLSFPQTIWAGEWKNAALNRAVYQSGAADYNHTAHLTTDHWPSTYWKGTSGDNWIYVDLGLETKVHSVSILWGDVQPDAFAIEVATSGKPENPVEWTQVWTGKREPGTSDSLTFKWPNARFVKISIPSSVRSEGPEIRTFRVWAESGTSVPAKKQPAFSNSSSWELTGGRWVIQRQSFVREGGEELSKSGFNTMQWIPATVPGTVLASYLAIGALPDPNFGDQQLMISEEFFTAPFWYRNEVQIPAEWKNRQLFLNLDGINWKADVFVNGHFAGKVNGSYIRGRINISDWVNSGKPAGIAILIYPNDNPGAVTEQHLNDPDGNGGIIGLDSPSILASIGWNWMPTIRGRNAGIWNSVWLEATGPIQIEDPIVICDLPLPDTTSAELFLETVLRNNSDKTVTGSVTANSTHFSISKEVTIPARGSRTVRFSSDEFSQLIIKNAPLWWPNGYGPQPLDSVTFSVSTGNQISHEQTVTFGFREFSYLMEQNHLRILINGNPLVIRGGNWGMSESMLRYSMEDYHRAVRLHRDMNLNMIRNWVGMVGDDAFYEYCDRYGLLIWDDFWLANPVDGPAPADEALFMTNAVDKVKRRRNHPSVAVWCGRNEGYPPASLDSSLRVMLQQTDNTRLYVSSSADRPVTGLGPYENKSPEWYFTHRGKTFHTEQGIVAPPVAESMREMMPESDLWPVNDMWGKHDWTQPRVRFFSQELDSLYGPAESIEDFSRKAQLINWRAAQGMMESWQYHRGGGVLLWMSHPAWPSLICQTYDYWFEPTAAYYGIRSGSEPVHIFAHPVSGSVQIANNLLKPFTDLSAEITIVSLNGQMEKVPPITVSLAPNSTISVPGISLEYKGQSTRFLRLILRNSNGTVLSRNFYWQGKPGGHFRDLHTLSQAELSLTVAPGKGNNETSFNLELTNKGSLPAFMNRLSLVNSLTGSRILPVYFSENFISLLPGESISISVIPEKKLPETVSIKLEGWNFPVRFIPINKL